MMIYHIVALSELSQNWFTPSKSYYY